MQLHELIPKSSENENALENENDTSYTLRSEYADDNIECREWEKETKMIESFTKQRNARKGEASAERDQARSCRQFFNALLQIHEALLYLESLATTAEKIRATVNIAANLAEASDLPSGAAVRSALLGRDICILHIQSSKLSQATFVVHTREIVRTDSDKPIYHSSNPGRTTRTLGDINS
jgi:hypothetical protein